MYKKGEKLSEEITVKRTEAIKEYYKTHNNAFKGRKHTEETKSKMRKAKEGTRNGKDNPFYDKKHKIKTKKKQRLANLGKKHTDKAKTKISESVREYLQNMTSEQKEKYKQGVIKRAYIQYMNAQMKWLKKIERLVKR